MAHEREAVGDPTSGWPRIGRFLRRVPRQDRARSVVSAILDAADESLDVAERGPLAKLFTRAGVAAGSFYEYFTSREALLSAALERLTLNNFDAFLREVDDAVAARPELEVVIRRGADTIARGYLARPHHLRAVIPIAERLGLLPHIARERDRFAAAVSVRLAPLAPALSDAQREAMMREVADVVTGIVVVSVFRSPVPDADVIGRTSAEAAWGVARAHVERATSR